jgi:hypothetical protein
MEFARSTRMASTSHSAVGDISADPFAERSSRPLSVYKPLLGGRFRFESTSAALMDLVEVAYGGLPPHRIAMDVPEFRIELRLVPGHSLQGRTEPPPVQMQSGAGVLCGVMDALNYVVVSPGQYRALIVASEDMLGFPYHLRYELIEFAVYILATRGLGLVPLHGACVGREGRGILLLGGSGAGKSTLALHSLLHGLDFLAEDAVLVQPDSLLATGVANYLHVKSDGLRFVHDASIQNWIHQSPIIRRRSGAEKFEVDLRLGHARLAASPLKLIGAVFVSHQPAEDPEVLLSPIPKADIAARLRADQPYAAGQPGWLPFQQKLEDIGVHELRRGRHPRASVAALLSLLG